MNIVLIGHVCIDRNTSEHASYTSWGSALMYMAQYYRSALGAEPTLISPYGRDFLPYAQGFSLLPGPHEGHTLVYHNLTQDGHRKQRCEHSLSAKPAALTESAKQAIRQADIVAVAPLLPNFTAEYLQDALQHKKSGSLAALLPQGYFRAIDEEGKVVPRAFKEASRILPLFDLVIFSEDDCAGGVGLAQKWSRQKGVCTIVTQGPRGASLITRDAVKSVTTSPVPEQEIVDSVGCGDVFSAAAMLSYYHKREALAAITAGNQAARAKLFQVSSALVKTS